MLKTTEGNKNKSLLKKKKSHEKLHQSSQTADTKKKKGMGKAMREGLERDLENLEKCRMKQIFF